MLSIMNTVITVLFSVLNAYTFFYIVIGMFKTRRFSPTSKLYRYAVVIPARNEEKVIAQLLDSIAQQSYPSHLIHVFVVADNCSDQTAEVAQQHGATVYQRFDKSRQTKGYALQFLFQQIEKNHGIKQFDGFFVFDADNLLKQDYIEKMNAAFASGEKIITSFRNSKNMDTNLWSSMNSLHFLRTNRFSHRPRSYLGLSTLVQGTGFLFARELVAKGWNYIDLTEDRSFSVDALLQGYRVSYCDDAVFYDEQPTDFKMVIRQRNRWAKGHLQVCRKVTKPLFIHMLKQRSFASYDVMLANIPLVLIMFLWTAFMVVMQVFQLASLQEILHMSRSIVVSAMVTWLILALQAIYLVLVESKRIIQLSWWQKIWMIATWPLFDVLEVPTKLMAFFSDDKWRPIPHTNRNCLREIEKATSTTK